MIGIIRGSVLRYGANINTDLISPSPYLGMADEIMMAHAMEGVDPDFPQKVRFGDIIVADANFGSGSSRESAAIVLKKLGVGAIVAPLFARIFYRNAINIGLPVVTCNAVENILGGDELEIDLLNGSIRNLTRGENYPCDELPPDMLALLEAGGFIEYLRGRTAL